MKKIGIKLFLLLLAIFLLPTNVFARDTITLKTDKEYLEIGEEVTVSAKLSTDKKLYALTATLTYDETVFEAIDDSNFDSTDKEIIYNAQNNKFGLINKSGELSDDLLTIHLKVKNDANVGRTTISLTNVNSSDGSTSYSYVYSSVDVIVTRDAEEGEVVPNNNAKEINDTEVSTVKTFTTKPIIVCLAVGVILLVSACIAVNLFEVTNKKRITLIIIPFIIIFIISIIALSVINANKKDVNGDGYNNYDDAREIIKYLIDIQGENPDENQNVEINTNIISDDQEQDDNKTSNNNANSSSSSRPNNSSSNGNNNSSNSQNNSNNNNQNQNNSQNNNQNNNPNNNQNNNPNNNQDNNQGNNQDNNNNNPGNTQENNNQNQGGNVNPNPDKRPDSDYDIDNDGDVDIDDAGGSVQDTTENTKYKVTINEINNENKYYYSKNEQFSLTFNATVSPNEKIIAVVIDGNNYPVSSDTSYYNVTLTTPNVSGVKEYKLSKVILSNKREIDVNLSVKREVIKDVPFVDLFDIDTDNNTFSFKLEDKDNAFKEGKVTIFDNENNEILNEKVQKENTFSYNFAEDVLYTIVVTGSYDLDTDSLNNITGEQNNFDNIEMYKNTFSLASNYEFNISNVTITDAIERNQKPIITFESNNNKNLKVNYIVIKDKQYNVTQIDENHYETILEDYDTSKVGKYYINIEKVVLENLKDFKNEKDYNISELSYNVLKSAPTIQNIVLSENKDEKTIETKYTVSDDDQTLINLTAILEDSTNKVVDTKKIENIGEDFSLLYKDNTDGRYRVKFIAEYNLGTDRHTYTDKNIGENEILTQTDIYIVSAKVSNVYPKKNEPKYKITYEVYVSDAIKQQSIEKNKVAYNVVSGITINGLNYDADKTKDAYTSNISFTVPSESGIIDLEATRVQLQYEDYNRNIHEFFSVKPYKTQIEVLKDKPSIENLEIINENYNSKQVTYRFNVVDDKGGFEFGTIELGEQVHPIKIGLNIVTFENIETDKLYDLNFYGNFDLDTNKLPDQEENTNKFEHDLLKTVPYGLYNKEKYDSISLNNVEAVSKNNNKYFEKDENININFNIEGLDPELNLTVDKIVIENHEYQIENTENNSKIIVKGFNESGERKLKIEEIILSNGKKVTLTNPIELTIEVLKDPVKISDFTYNIDEENINMNFSIKDSDKSLKGNASQKIKIKVFDEDGEEIESYPYQNKIQLKLRDGILRYYIGVFANYDRDNIEDNINSYENDKILDEVISIDKNTIELKDITDITLYKEENGNTSEIDEVSVDEISSNKESYFIRISMTQLPSFNAKIKDVVVEDNKLVLILDSEYAVKENDKEIKDLRIVFGTIYNGIARNEARPENLEEFINKITSNPSGEFTLENDLDAGNYITESNSLINVSFTGKLNGNGHTIKNLRKPLFNEINNGTVENLKLDDVILPSTNAQGSLTNTTNKATIKNILINRYTKKGSEATTGALIGRANNSTLIENCKVSNLDLGVAWGLQGVGGLIGVLDSSTVRNCYAVGNLDGGWNFRGGLVGNVYGTSTIENCISKVTQTGGIGTNSGFVSVYTGRVILKNNICLGTGWENGFTNTTPFEGSENNYQISITNGETGKNSIQNIKQEDITESFFRDTLHFDETIWNLKDSSFDKTPTFNMEKVSKINIDEVKDEYDESKETLYNNLILLMPFYNSNKIVKSSLNIDESNPLYSKELTHIVPIDENGNIVTYITSDNPGKIKKIKLIFKDNTKMEYDVRYDNTYDMVASYRISDLKIDYTYNHYIINSNSQLVNNLTNYLSTLTYDDNLDKLTPTIDSRLYRDYYNEVTKFELKEFVLKYLSNTNYTNTTNNEVIDDFLEKEIKKDQKLEKLLYVYNYFNRFYSVNIGGIKLNDLILFGSQGFNENMNPENIASLYLLNENNFTLSRTNDAYKDTLAKYTNIETIPDLLEYFVTELTDLNPAEWYAKEFKGYLIEINVPERTDILYTLWDHIKYKDTHNRAVWHNYALPILTLPKDAAYIISTPTQFLIGAQRIYTSRPDTPEGQIELQDYVNKYKSRMQDYYTTAAGILNDSIYFNEIHTIQIDRRFTKDINGNDVFQSPYQTQEPFHKNFNEVFGHWAHQDGNAATANGTVIYWRAEGALHGEWTYATWSHETAHNIDSRLFLKNNGRRFDAGGEDYADNNLSQRFNQNDITMNISKRYEVNDTERIASNLVPERINTPEKIKDFYEKVFDTIYIMDYLEGQAFLKLTPEEQSKLVVQVSYPNETDPKIDKEYLKRKNTVYQTVTEEQIKDMKLNTMEDLYTNRLVIYPGVIYSTVIDNRYGGEGINKVRWYQPHNDKGRPDSYSLKWLAYEMMGIGGYDGGYIEYYSNINSITNGDIQNYKDDLMALRAVTGQPEITFETYKKQRFDRVKDNLTNIQVINVNEYFDKLYNAMKEDAEKVKQTEIEAKTKYPNETESDINNRNNMISNARQFEKSTEVRRQLYFELKNGTNDFENKVYDENHKQVVKEFTIPEK